MRNNLIIAALFTLSACNSTQDPEYVKFANNLTSQFCSEVSKPKGLALTGYGGALMYDVKKINLHYDSHECLNLEEARKLYVEIAEKYLAYINDNEDIRPYLHDYPFTIKNLELAIAFRGRSGKRCNNGCIAFIFRNLKTSEIIFRTSDEDGKKLIPFHQEPYEEAKRIVESSSKP